MTDKDMKRFWELEKKMDEGTATDEELWERDMLWTSLQTEEEADLRNWYQFGY